MAADLQMICILTLPVLALIAWPRKGIWLIGAIAVTSIIYAGSMLIIYETTPTILFTPLTLSNVSKILDPIIRLILFSCMFFILAH